jgi:hypothetical protein
MTDELAAGGFPSGSPRHCWRFDTASRACDDFIQFHAPPERTSSAAGVMVRLRCTSWRDPLDGTHGASALRSVRGRRLVAEELHPRRAACRSSQSNIPALKRKSSLSSAQAAQAGLDSSCCMASNLSPRRGARCATTLEGPDFQVAFMDPGLFTIGTPPKRFPTSPIFPPV